MDIVVAYPPMFEEIAAVFPNARKPGVIFTWGSTLYNPSGITVSPELRAHEGVHYTRQGADVEGWWRRYLTDAEFRLAEEIPAHRAEARQFKARHADRNAYYRYVHHVAERLASPLYGSLLTPAKARTLILS
jgi:hypothetical protein